jgi:excisionase family DNA binding protein
MEKSIERLLSSREAAKYLGISPRTLWSLTACNELPCVRIGRSVRYDLHDLSAWIESRKTRGGRA